MKKHLKRSSLASASVCTLVMSLNAAPAVAQDESSEDAVVSYGEVIVTARKRDENLSEVPVAVSAFGQEAINDLGVTSLDGLSDFTQGFEFVDDTRVNNAIRFRGLGAVVESAATRSGAVFWDGGYVSDGVPILPLIDVERVEVIKGPQNAFFGRNTFSGAVNFISKEPGDEWSGMALASYSATDDDSYNFTGAYGGPVTDTFGIRVAASFEKEGADFEYANGDPNGEIETASFTGTAVWEPTDTIKLKTSGYYATSEDTISQVSQAPTFPAGSCNLVYSGNLRSVFTGANLGDFSTNLADAAGATFCGSVPDFDEQPPWVSPAGSFGSAEFLDTLSGFSASPERASTLPVEFNNRDGLEAPDGLGGKYSVWRVNASGEYELSNGAAINASVARGEANNWNIGDGNFGAEGAFGTSIFIVGFIRWTRDTTAEVRYISPQDERLRYNIGVSYYEQELNQADAPFLGRQTINVEEGENFGIFGSVDFDVTDALTASFEGRWNEDTQTVVFNGLSELTDMDPDPVRNEEQSYSKFMPRFILAYEVNENANLYGSYSRSFIQGIATNAEAYSIAVPDSGVNVDSVGFFTPVQQLDAYEIGFKHTPTPWMRYSASTYYMEWENQVFADLSPRFVPVNLAGDSRIIGVEFEGEVRPTSWLEFIGGINYNDVEFTDFAGAGSTANRVLAPGLITGGVQIDADGNTPRFISEWSGSLSTVVQLNDLFDFERDAFARLDAVYTGDFFIDNFAFNEVDAYVTLNARAGVSIADGMSLEVYATNLTNDQSWGTTSGGETTLAGTSDRILFGTLPRKREVGVRLRFDF